MLALAATLFAHFKSHKGELLGQMAKGLGVQTAELNLPVQTQFAQKAIVTKGVQRGTMYFVKSATCSARKGPAGVRAAQAVDLRLHRSVITLLGRGARWQKQSPHETHLGAVRATLEKSILITSDPFPFYEREIKRTFRLACVSVKVENRYRQDDKLRTTPRLVLAQVASALLFAPTVFAHE